MPSHPLVHTALVAAAGLVLAAGCESSFDSSAAVSEIISSPVTSLSASSSPEAAYRRDVRDFTAAHVKAGGTAEALRRELGKVAAKRGISDWEQSESTYRGVGEGLRDADYNRTQLDAFVGVFAATPAQREWIEKGYGSR